MNALHDPRFRLGAAALALLLASFLLHPIAVSRPIYDVMAVLDITGSMNVRDQALDGAPASRLAVEKRAVQDLLARLPCGSRLGVAIFVEKQPFPLFEPIETCGNFAVLNEAIGDIDWRMGWDGESHIAFGLLAGMTLARDLRADLVFMTDGQETPPLWWTGPANFAPVRGQVHGLIVGLGGHDFAPIPKFDDNGREIGVWKPGEVPSERGGLFRGHEHLSAVDEPHLQALSADSGLAYWHLTSADALLPALLPQAAPRVRPSTLDLRWVLASLALALLFITMLPARWLERGGNHEAANAARP